MPPALPDDAPPAPYEGPTLALDDTLVTVLCEQLTFHQREQDAAERLEAALGTVWHLERERSGSLHSLAEARGALDLAGAELNSLWNAHREAFLDDRPALLQKICIAQSRSDALWLRIRELGG